MVDVVLIQTALAVHLHNVRHLNVYPVLCAYKHDVICIEKKWPVEDRVRSNLI